MKRRNLSSAAAAALLAASVPVAPEVLEEMEVLEETAEVTVVEVPVNVYGRDGEPVSGLEAADFEIYDRGRLRHITSLERIDLSSDDLSSDDLPPSARRRFLLLFDLAFSRPTAVAKARLAARDFVLDALHPSDLAAVMIFTLETGPRFLVSFTSDRGQLARALDTLGAPAMLGGARVDDPLRLLIEAPDTSGGIGLNRPAALLGADAPSSDQRSAEVLAYLRSIDRQIDRGRKTVDLARITAWSRALGELGRMLGRLDGRKRLIYFSEGFDGTLLTGEPPADATARDNLEAERGEHWLAPGNALGDASLRGHLRRMVEEMRRSDTVIDTIDIGGLTVDESAQRKGRRASLLAVARGTGGELFDQLNDLGALLERSARSTAVTYVLSFQPADLELDGSFHRLEVRLRGERKARLSHRSGYYAPVPFAELHPLEKSLLASDAIVTATPRHDLRLETLVAPFRAGPGSSYVPVILEIDGPSLLDGQSSPVLEVEIFAYVSDPRGTIVDFFTHRATLDLVKARPRLESSGLKFYGHLDLSAGRYLARILVRNAETGRTSVRSVPLDLQAVFAGPTLLPPFFLESPGAWVLTREQLGRAHEERMVYPFTARGVPFVPAIRPALRSGQTVEIWLVAYDFGGSPAFEGRVLSAEGAAVSGGYFGTFERLQATAGRAEALVRFEPRDLAPGDYTLEISVRGVEGTREASSFASFVVE